MDLVGEIVPALVALYVFDGALLVRAGQVLFASGWGGVVSTLGPGLRFPGLLPSAEAVVGASLPLRACEDGVRVPVAGAPDRLVTFDSMPRVVAEGGVVRLGRGVHLPVRPHALAPEVAAVVERLRITPRSRRLARLRREVRRRGDARALAALRSRHVEGLPPLRALSWASFVAWFVVLPASLAPQLPVRPAPLAAMALVLVLWLASVAASVRLLHGCGARGRPLWGALLPLLLFPPASAHAASLVTRELYLGYEPEALASQLLAPAALEAYRRECEPPDSSDRTWEVAAIARQLVTRGRRPPANVPARRDASAVSFCPRCHGEYRAGFARCSDCGVTLARYGP